MWRAAGFACLVLAALLGCSKPALNAGAGPSPSPSATAEPDARASAPGKLTLRERLRSGSFQVQASLDSLETAVNKCGELLKSATGADKEALKDLLDKLNSVGEVLGDRSTEPPSQQEIGQDPAAFEKLAKESQDDAEDSITELTEVLDSIDTLLQSAKDDRVEGLDALRTLVEAVMQDVSGARDAFAGIDAGGQ